MVLEVFKMVCILAFMSAGVTVAAIGWLESRDSNHAPIDTTGLQADELRRLYHRMMFDKWKYLLGTTVLWVIAWAISTTL